MDNFQEYEDPVSYDIENDSYIGEVPFLNKWAKRKKGTIIDLACGTGRVTIPLAMEGHKLIGIDIHQGMLNQAKQKAAHLQQIEWIAQDCTKLDLGIRSPFIYMVGNSFQHFLTNEAQDMLLQSVNQHLENAGIFIFDTRFPSNEELLQPATEEYWKSYYDNGKKIDVYTKSKYDALAQIQHYITIRNNENGEERKTNILLRYVFPKEMERLLADNGFEILSVYKDWQETPITADSYQIVYVCRKSNN